MNMQQLCSRIAATAAVFLMAPSGISRAAIEYKSSEVMVPVRDGIKLHTVLVRPKGAEGPLPILLQRTPYGVPARAMEAQTQGPLKRMADDGYIFAFQDIRGRFGSEGTFVLERPARDASDPKSTDETTDAYDSIDWLVKNVAGNNGRVGIWGISYPGWLTVQALLEPHPALRAASPQASPGDQFLCDDEHHNGAFRLSPVFQYLAVMGRAKEFTPFDYGRRDLYDWFLDLGPLSNVDARHFHGKVSAWNDAVEHPDYDRYWRERAVPPRLGHPRVPTLNVVGWWDQEDFSGPLRIYEAFEKQDTDGLNSLVVGPWNHGGWMRTDGDRLGPVTFGRPTSRDFREEVMAPWFARHLKDKPGLTVPEARVFRTGENAWHTYDRWPPREARPRYLYARAGGKLAFEPPLAAPDGDPGFDSYLSDPAHPVPFRPRPIGTDVIISKDGRVTGNPEWSEWLVQDQRFVHQRPDVLSYETAPLGRDVDLAGRITARLFASTSGTDCDWVVKLIDVYPEDDPAMGGYQLIIANEVFRARYRKAFDRPEPLTADRVEPYVIDLHHGAHRFRTGHRIMVQIQSTWFPLIDRNPQTYVPNIYRATEIDFRPATQRVFRTDRYPTAIELTVLPD
jgi:putative CocE/NonD family hydrolase